MDDVTVDPQVGDSMTCPGCGEKVTLDWADGWRNDNGLTCKPARTTHSDHIVTLMSNLTYYRPLESPLTDRTGVTDDILPTS